MIHSQLPASPQFQSLFERAARPLVFVLILLISGGSADTPAIATTTISPLPEIPSVSQLHIQLPPDNFHTLDFMALHGCLLQITLGKYQSVLGRHASDSQRLLLDLEFLSLAPRCIQLNKTAKTTALAATLESIQSIKRHQLAARIYNATLANTEFQQLWQGAPRHHIAPNQEKLTLYAIAEIKASIKRWLNGNYQASNLDFEIQLSEVASADLTATCGWNIHRVTTQLEALLRTSLPPQYRVWQDRRVEYFTRLTPSTRLRCVRY